MRGCFAASLVIAIAAPGCYLSHRRASAPADADGGRPRDAGAVVVDRRDARATVPDADPTLPDADRPVERPSEELSCDSGEEVLLELCGALVRVHVAPGGRAGASGAPDDPFGTLSQAAAACGERCEIRIASGELPIGTFAAPSCAWISGGWSRGAGGWSPSDEPTTLRVSGDGTAISTHGRLLVENVHIEGPPVVNGELGAIVGEEGTDLLVVRHVSIVAAYSGIQLVRASGLRVCGTQIHAGYAGIEMAFDASDAILEDVDIEAGYSGVEIGWSSSRVLIRNSRIHGGYEGVGISWSSHDVAIEGSIVEGAYNGVGVAWDSHHVSIDDSTILGCYEPIGVGTGAWGVKVDDGTMTGPCTGSADAGS